MRDEYKKLRPWLESWGAWRRMTSNIDYPMDSVSCNPDLHTALTPIEPSFKMPIYNEKLTPEHNSERLLAHEKKLREFYHVKRSYGKNQQTSRVPNFDPNWRLNFIDREIMTMPELQKQVTILRYEREYKIKEIAKLIDRTIEAIHKRIADSHGYLKHIPRLMVSRESCDDYIKNCRSLSTR